MSGDEKKVVKKSLVNVIYSTTERPEWAGPSKFGSVSATSRTMVAPAVNSFLAPRAERPTQVRVSPKVAEAMRRVMQAVVVLNRPSASSEQRGKANAFAVHVRRDPIAWDVSDKLLRTIGVPLPVFFFAANALLEKLVCDWDELEHSGAHLALMKTIVAHLHKFREGPTSVRRKLAMCAATLVVRMIADQELAEGIGHLVREFSIGDDRAKNSVLVFEYLSEIPQAFGNARLGLTPEKRTRCSQAITLFSHNTLGILCNYLKSANGDAGLCNRVFQCLLDWIESRHTNILSLIQHPITDALLAALASASTREVATQCLEAIASVVIDYQDAGIRQLCAKKLVPRCVKVVATQVHQEETRGMAALLNQLGTSFARELPADSALAAAFSTAIFKCSSSADRTVSSACFEFWQSVTPADARKLGFKSRDLVRVFQAWVRNCMLDNDEDEEIEDYRHGVAECIYKFPVDSHTLVESTCKALQKELRSGTWKTVESLLFALRSRPVESKFTPALMVLLAQEKSLRHPRVFKSALLLMGHLAKSWTAFDTNKRAILDLVVSAIDSKCCPDTACRVLCGMASNRQFRVPAKALDRAFHAVLRSKPMCLDNVILVTKSVLLLLPELEEKDVSRLTNMVVQPALVVLKTQPKSRAPGVDADAANAQHIFAYQHLAAVFDSLSSRKTTAALLSKSVVPLAEQHVKSCGDQDGMVEAVCECLLAAVNSGAELAAVSSILLVASEALALTAIPAYVAVVRACVIRLPTAPAVQRALARVLTMVSKRLTRLTQFEAAADLSVGLFSSLMPAFVTAIPELFYKTMTTGNWLSTTLCCLTSDNRRILESACAFYVCILSPPTKSTHAHVGAWLETHGAFVVGALVGGTAHALPSAHTDLTRSVYTRLLHTCRIQAVRWIEASIGRVTPKFHGDSRAKRTFGEDVLSVVDVLERTSRFNHDQLRTCIARFACACRRKTRPSPIYFPPTRKL